MNDVSYRGCKPYQETVNTSRGSLCRQHAINSRNSLEKLPSRVGGGFLGMRNKT